MTDREWKLIRDEFGDVAYECPELHDVMLAVVRRPRLVVDNTRKK